MTQFSFKTLLFYSLSLVIILYFIQSIFKIEVNIFFIPLLLFMPGLLFLQLFKFDKRSLSEIILFSVIISPVLTAAAFYFYGYIFHRAFAGFTPSYLTLLLVWSIFNFIRFKERSVSIFKKDIMVLISGFVFILPLIYLERYPRIQLSYDGAIFTGMAYQIKNNFIPPDNPDAFAVPSGTYWLYSAYLAVVSQALNISPLLVSAWMAPAAMLSTFILGVYIMGNFFKSIGYQILGSFLMIAGPGMQNSLKFLYLLISKKEILIRPENDPNQIMELISVFPNIDSRLTDLFHKFLGDGFRFGLVFFLLVLLSLHKILIEMDKKYLPIFTAGIFGLIIFHPVSFIPLLIIIPATVLFVCLLKGSDVKRTLITVVGFLFPVAAMAPYLIDIQTTSVWPQISFDFQPTNIINFLLTYSISLPLVILGLNSFRNNKNPIAVVILAVYLSGLVILGASLSLPDGNQYKFTFLSGAVISIISIKGIQEIRRLLGSRLRFLSVIFLSILILAQYGMFIYAYRHSRWTAAPALANDGTSIINLSDPEIEHGFKYLRDKTEKSAIIVSIPPQKSIGMFTQRRSFADLSSNPLLWKYQNYPSRLRILQGFSKNNVNPEQLVKRIVTETKSEPVYLILPNLDNSRFKDLSNQMTSMNDLISVYSNERLTVFRFTGHRSESKNIFYGY